MGLFQNEHRSEASGDHGQKGFPPDGPAPHNTGMGFSAVSRGIAASSVCLLLLATGCAKSIDHSLIPEQQPNFQENLAKGKIYTSALPIGGTPSRLGKVIGVVDAPVDDVWKVVVDYGSYKHFMPLIWESDLIGSEGNKADARLQFQIKPIPVIYWCILRYNHNPGIYHIDWQQVEGDIKNTYGSYDLAPFPDANGNRTKLTYQLYFEIGNPLLDTGADWLTETVLPAVITRIRDRVKEANPSMMELPAYARPQMVDTQKQIEDAMRDVELR